MPAPNVLFITVDQWRGECLSSLGHPVVETPNLDRLAAGGVHFTRHFAQAAPCGPSRASIYTGMYMMNHRSVLNGTPLDARFTNIALEARALGYTPALFGYTDTSVDPRTVPAGDPRLSTYEGVLPGFDPVCHVPEGDPQPWLQWLSKHGYDIPSDWRAFVDRPAPGTRWQTQYAAEHSEPAFLTEQVVEYLEQHGEQHGDAPWFVHVSYLRPHPPFLAPAPYVSRYDPDSVPPPVRAATRDEEGAQHPLFALMIRHPLVAAPDDEQELRELRATYFAMMHEVDHHLGRLFDWLDDNGVADDTIVVVTSDHGEMLGDHYVLHKLGWFDASYHVPCLVRAPGAVEGRRVDAFTENVDLLPTVLDLLGAPVPLQCDGRSLVPFLRGDGVAGWRREVHFEFDFREPADARLEKVFDVAMEDCALAVLRDDHGKYVQFGGHPNLPPLFFDLDDDPAQVVNRAADPAYASRVLDYAQRMLAWRIRFADRTLTGTKLTGQGPIIRRS